MALVTGPPDDLASTNALDVVDAVEPSGSDRTEVYLSMYLPETQRPPTATHPDRGGDRAAWDAAEAAGATLRAAGLLP